FGNGFQVRGNARLAEIFLGQHVARHLAPAFGNLDVGLLENHRSVRVSDLAGGVAERDALIGRGVFDGELTPDTHGIAPKKLKFWPIPPRPEPFQAKLSRPPEPRGGRLCLGLGLVGFARFWAAGSDGRKVWPRSFSGRKG